MKLDKDVAKITNLYQFYKMFNNWQECYDVMNYKQLFSLENNNGQLDW